MPPEANLVQGVTASSTTPSKFEIKVIRGPPAENNCTQDFVCHLDYVLYFNHSGKNSKWRPHQSKKSGLPIAIQHNMDLPAFEAQVAKACSSSDMKQLGKMITEDHRPQALGIKWICHIPSVHGNQTNDDSQLNTNHHFISWGNAALKNPKKKPVMCLIIPKPEDLVNVAQRNAALAKTHHGIPAAVDATGSGCGNQISIQAFLIKYYYYSIFYSIILTGHNN
ncbi:hypothetical protein DFH28DRAFT_1128317 [Melampsora americana]|nr:hypothetical protein DFH28DRAFT_1128317 [Melampsora americana]